MAKLDLSEQIAKAMRDYTDEVEEGLVEAQLALAKDGVKELKERSQVLTGDYRKGWTYKKTSKGFVLHNKTNYQLTHLLEKGHALAGGGRSRKFVHIEPVEERLVKEYVEEVERLISR